MLLTCVLLTSLFTYQDGFEFVSSSLISGSKCESIGIHGYLNIPMAESLRNDFGMNSLVDQERSARMPKRMKLDVP